MELNVNATEQAKAQSREDVIQYGLKLSLKDLSLIGEALECAVIHYGKFLSCDAGKNPHSISYCVFQINEYKALLEKWLIHQDMLQVILPVELKKYKTEGNENDIKKNS